MSNRLDNELVARGHVKTRSQARLLVIEGNVLVNGSVSTKPAKEVLVTDSITVTKKTVYVSRGGDKLEAAAKAFSINFLNKKVLDIGSSTGGFSDYALQNGAQRVYAFDVGTDQFDNDLKKDSRVVLYENTDIRAADGLQEPIDIVVIDVSFISLEHIIPVLGRFVGSSSEVVALIKPQFEVGKKNLNRQGIVTDEGLYEVVVDKISKQFTEEGYMVRGVIPSPVVGGSGNKEFLLYAKKNNST